jgi:hypothetical protein
MGGIPVRPFIPLLTFAATMVLLAAPPADAYLMLVRQGEEAPEVANANDWLGWAVASGDFDGDGFDDLAMGAPGENEDVLPAREHGAVIVNYGSPRGIRHTGSDFLTIGAITETIVHYGIAVASGDFNQDGYDDLAVGAPDFDGSLGTVSSSGTVWIHLGGPGGLQGTPSQVIESTLAGDPLEAFDRFGAALAAGDFDLDGFDDLAVGAPGEDGGSGAVFVLRGSGAGIIPSGAVALRPLTLGFTPEADGHFGATLAAGALFGGAEEDLAIGAPERDVAGQPDVGMVWIAAGSAAGITSAGALRIDPQVLGSQVFAETEFGFALAIGHFRDSATYPNQLAIGAPGHLSCDGPNCGNDVGRVFVLRSFVAPFNFSSYDLLDQFDTGATGENELGDRFGAALAAGDWDDDGYDDIAVGVPAEDVENQPVNGLTTGGAGSVFLWTGGGTSFDASGFSRFHARTLNDTLETGAQVGWSLAFGRFDDSGRANLAIGAPLKDHRDYRAGTTTNSSGSVYVLAPWRQLQGRPNRCSIALDCNGAIVYAQRHLQSVTPASVTKAMTVLLAVEAIQGGAIDSNFVYTVPDWVANNVSGSQAGLTTGQQIRFVDLIKLAISISAGDACYGIGDILTGGNHVWNGLDNTIPGFSVMMNQRADDLGMTRTNFNNPSGRPFTNHYSTAWDWAQFAGSAMTNPLFRYFAGTRVWADIPNWPVTANGWLQGMQDNWFAATDGIKPGGNALSMQTALCSADDPLLGRHETSVFGVPTTRYGSPFTDSAAGASRDLLQLGLAACTPGLAPPPPGPDPTPWAWGHLTGLPTGPGPDPAPCLLLPLGAQQSGDARIEVYAEQLATASAAFELEVWRSSEIVLGPGQSAVLSISPVDAHAGFRIFNVARTAANLSLTTTTPAGTTPVVLASEGEHVVPAEPSLPGTFALTIANTSSSGDARLQVDELGYTVDGAVGSRGPFVVTLRRDPHQEEEVVRVCVGPGDPGPGNTVYLVLRPPGGTVGVDPPVVVATAPGIRLRAATPNPFQGATALAYELTAAAVVGHALYDAAGRCVRTLERAAPRDAGPHAVAWDGRDDAGRAVPAGVYFQRVHTAGGTATQRLVRLR